MPIESPINDVEIPNVSLTDYMLNCLNKHGDDIAIVDVVSGNSVTFLELNNNILCCAKYLKDQGVKRGDMVAVCTRHCVEMVTVMLGVIACGGIVVPSDPVSKTGEFLRQFKASRPSVVFVSEDGLETMNVVKSRLPDIKKIIVFGKSKKYSTFDDIINKRYKTVYNEDTNGDPENDIAIILYSSGTTGSPKGILLTHKNITSYILSFNELSNYQKHDKFYVDRPMFGPSGLKYTLFSLAIGMKTFTSSIQHDDESVLKILQDYKIDRMIGTPQVVLMLANNDNHKKYNTSALKQIQIGGASVPPNILRKVAEKYKVNILLHYAMTEVGTIATNNKPLVQENVAGYISPNVVAKIVSIRGDTLDKELANGECGEIVVKGPLVTKGYLGNPGSAFDVDGWFHTGDIGYFDQENKLYITGRLREMIKYKTVQIFPNELENVLMTHPKITDVGVIGIPDFYCGEFPKAFVVRNEKSLNEQEVKDFVESELSEHKHLRGGVEFVEHIPRSVLGKIQRFKLKNLSLEGSATMS